MRPDTATGRRSLASPSAASPRLARLREYLRPVTTVDARPSGSDVDRTRTRYVRSFLILRVAVGALGIALPFVLVFTDGVWFDGRPYPRNSISAYYYSGMRDVLVGTVWAIGVFLVAYKAAERNLDNTLSNLAGITAVPIALFPPHLPPGREPLPIQDHLGADACAAVHLVSAAIFLIALAILSVCFGIREGRRKARVGKRSPMFWRIYHWACAGIIGVALLWMGFTQVLHFGPRTALLFGESVSLVAFGASWLWKGLELDVLRASKR